MQPALSRLTGQTAPALRKNRPPKITFSGRLITHYSHSLHKYGINTIQKHPAHSFSKN